MALNDLCCASSKHLPHIKCGRPLPPPTPVEAVLQRTLPIDIVGGANDDVRLITRHETKTTI